MQTPSNKGEFWQDGYKLPYSSPYMPQLKGLVQSVNSILVEIVEAMIDSSGLKLFYWCEAGQHATDLHNRAATPEMRGKPLVGALLGLLPSHSRLRVFGYAPLVHRNKENRCDQLEDRTETGI